MGLRSLDPALTPQLGNPSGLRGLLCRAFFSLRVLCVAQTGMGAPGGLGWGVRQHQQTKREETAGELTESSLLQDHTRTEWLKSTK